MYEGIGLAGRTGTFQSVVCEDFPKAFVPPILAGKGMLPLKHDIVFDLLSAYPDVADRTIREFLHHYTTRFWYVRCCTFAGNVRVDIRGAVVGRVTVAEADEAQAVYDRIFRQQVGEDGNLCRKSGKVAYGTGGDALVSSRRARQSNEDTTDVEAYRCDHCAGFHWGHVAYRQRRRGEERLARAYEAPKMSKSFMASLIAGE